jgi:hypothetical protein
MTAMAAGRRRSMRAVAHASHDAMPSAWAKALGGAVTTASYVSAFAHPREVNYLTRVQHEGTYRSALCYP